MNAPAAQLLAISNEMWLLWAGEPEVNISVEGV